MPMTESPAERIQRVLDRYACLTKDIQPSTIEAMVRYSDLWRRAPEDYTCGVKHPWKFARDFQDYLFIEYPTPTLGLARFQSASPLRIEVTNNAGMESQIGTMNRPTYPFAPRTWNSIWRWGRESRFDRSHIGSMAINSHELQPIG